MTIDAAYDRWADQYDDDRNLTRDLDQRVTAEVLGGHRFAMAVEAGCGTGKNTPFFAGISQELLAFDFSDGMLARARSRVREGNVRFEKADLLHPWPCDDGAAGLVSCNLVLEHVEDLDHVFSEAARCLAPGGLFFSSELHPYRQYQGSQARFVDGDGESVTIAAHVHHVSDFVRSATKAGLRVERLDEWWHAEDDGRLPRLLSLLLRKNTAQSVA